jgi:hypothetical protein
MRNGNGIEQTVAMMPIYYPGVSDPTLAAPVSVRADADAGGFTVVVRPEPVTTIELTIDSGGREISNLRVLRVPLDDRWDDALRNSSDGQRFESVPAGRFLLVADGELHGTTPVRLWATQDISSDGITPLSATLTLQPGGRISGRLVFEGTTRPPASLGALLIPIGPGATGALTGTQRNATFTGQEFSIADVLPGRYLLRVNEIYPSSSWMLKSITMSGQNVLDLPIEITAGSDVGSVVVTFTDRVTEVSGIVTDAAGRPLGLETVVAFPNDSRYWRIPSLITRHASTDSAGRYVIRGLPPGDFRVSVGPTPDGSVPPALFSKLLPLSVAVVIAPGDRKIVNLTR